MVRRFTRMPAQSVKFSLLCVVFCCCALTPALVRGQDAENDPNGGLIFKVNARTVVVNVVVTDHNGKPVKGLRREDFRLEENSYPQKISAFEDHTRSEEPASVSLKASSLPPNVFVNIPRGRQSDVVTVVLLDSLNTELKDQSYLRKKMLQFLKDRPLEGRIAIFGLGAKLHYIQGFTDDPAILSAALKNLNRGSGPINSELLVSKTQASVTQTVTDELLNVGNEGRASDRDLEMAAVLRQFLAESSASQSDLRVALTLEGFQELAHYLAGIPGRKNVVWYSSSFPITLFPGQALIDSMAVQREYSAKVRRTDALLAAAQVAVYPVAAEGLTTDSLYDVNVKMAVIGQAQQKEQINSLQSDAAERIGTHTAMQQIAEDTGGQAIVNTNGLGAALAHVQQVGSSFYTLSYIPTNTASDGQFRQIRLKLAGGYNLDYRRGYFAADAKSEAAAGKIGSDPLSAFMGPGKPNSSDISMALHVFPGTLAAPQPSAPASANPPSAPKAEAKADAKPEIETAVDFDTQPASQPVQPPAAAPRADPKPDIASAVDFDTQPAGQPAQPGAAETAAAPTQPTSSRSVETSPVPQKSLATADSAYRAGDNPRLSGDMKRYSVDFLLTTHGVQMSADGAGTHHGKIEAALIAYNQNGRALNWTEREIHFDLDAAHFAQAEKGGLNFRLEIDVPKDGYSIRSGVYDLASERAGSLEIPLKSVVAPAETRSARSN